MTDITSFDINGRDGILLIDAQDRSPEVDDWHWGPGTRQSFASQRASLPRSLSMVIHQNTDASSLHTLATTADGTSYVGVWKPHGNDTASPTQPHYTFTTIPSGPTGDTIYGGKSSADATASLTVQVEWLVFDWAQVTA